MKNLKLKLVNQNWKETILLKIFKEDMDLEFKIWNKKQRTKKENPEKN